MPDKRFSEEYYSVRQEKAVKLGDRLAEIENLLRELDLDLLDKEIREANGIVDYGKLHPAEVKAAAERVGSEAKIAGLMEERRRITEQIQALAAEDHEAYHKLRDYNSQYLN